MRLPVLCAAEGAAWEQRLVRAFDRGEHTVQIVRRCVDIVDVLAVAAAGQGRAVLLAASLRRLDPDAVDRLLAAGVAPVGVIARDDDAAQERLLAAGVEFLVPEDADPAVVETVLTEAVRAREQVAGGSDSTSRVVARTFGDPSTSMAIPPGEGAPVAPGPPTRRGSVVAVWGPTGAPGRTTVAVTLAGELARLGCDTLLIDLDVYGGTVAATLGLLDESPGVAAACRQAGSRRVDAAVLAGLCWQLDPRLRVLTGIPLAARWPELRPAAVPPVLAAARALAAYTVVDLGFCLETDEELSFDTMAPRRNGATLAVLDDADLVLAVGSADPVGMQRLVRGLAELRDAEVAAPTWAVLNRVRDAVVPGDTGAELSAAMQRFAGVTPSALLPADHRGLDAAMAAGRMLGESHPASPLRKAVAELAATVSGRPAARTQRGRRRRR